MNVVRNYILKKQAVKPFVYISLKKVYKKMWHKISQFSERSSTPHFQANAILRIERLML